MKILNDDGTSNFFDARSRGEREIRRSDGVISDFFVRSSGTGGSDSDGRF
jgi:hypothetical protein